MDGEPYADTLPKAASGEPERLRLWTVEAEAKFRGELLEWIWQDVVCNHVPGELIGGFCVYGRVDGLRPREVVFVTQHGRPNPSYFIGSPALGWDQHPFEGRRSLLRDGVNQCVAGLGPHYHERYRVVPWADLSPHLPRSPAELDKWYDFFLL